MNEDVETLAEVLHEPALLNAVNWRINNYGPLDAEPFRWSRFESPAHAALEPVADALAPLLDQARADAAEKALAPVLALADDAERATRESFSRMFNGQPFPAQVSVAALRAAVASHQEGGA